MTIVMDKVALTAFLQREFAQVADDFTVLRVDADVLELRLDVGPQHLRPGGTVSGPSLFALADVAMYLAILARLGPVALAVTTNCSIDFMRKPEAGRALIAQARVLKLGRVLAVGDVLIRSEGPAGTPDTAIVARAGLTYSVPPKA